MPAELVRAVEKAVGRRESPHRTLQDASTQLTGDLRNRSRTKGKGGSRLMPHKEALQRPLEEPVSCPNSVLSWFTIQRLALPHPALQDNEASSI